jgi:hypothetical protein
METNIYRVYSGSGLDAFEVLINGVHIYLPYFDVIAHNEEEARIHVSLIINQKLDDQETNLAYPNYISKHVEFISKF